MRTPRACPNPPLQLINPFLPVSTSIHPAGNLRVLSARADLLGAEASLGRADAAALVAAKLARAAGVLAALFPGSRRRGRGRGGSGSGSGSGVLRPRAELQGADAPLGRADAAALVAAELARAAGVLAALGPGRGRRRRLGLPRLGAAAHGAEIAGLDAGAAQRVAADLAGGAPGVAAPLELADAAGLAVLHLAPEARAAEDGGARQRRLRGGLGDALGLAVDHLATVLAPHVGARDVAAAAGQDGVRHGAEGGGEEEEGFHDGGHRR